MAPPDPKPHIIVIGGGIIGASLAWHLTAQQRASITLIAPTFAYATGGSDDMATPNSFAWLNAAWGNPRFYYDLRRRSMYGWHRLSKTVPGLDGVMKWCGSLTWDLTPGEREAYCREHASWGYDIRRVQRGDVRAREPAIGERCLPEWAIFAADEGYVEPVPAARLMIEDAQRHGARLVTASVTKLLKSGGAVTGVVTSDSRQILGDHVVLAAGNGSAQLCASVGITLPLKSPAGLIVHSKPLPTRVLNGIVISPNLHMRQTTEGRIIAGAGFAGGDPGSNPETAARELLAKVGELLPGQRDALEMDFFTIGYRPTPQDGLPVLGPVGQGLTGLTLAVMHSGVTLAAIVGQLLTDLVLDGKSDPALADFKLDRLSRASKL